ncbi:cleft lip and palate associated transmembrane protein [Boletus reticuloceps]|uniref:Cleft lip and palate associated transmembrane protein n=1 Tax=Boletus reticuloceps TaxID=495285 RepID=A0A8I3A6R3_9AGAM|nr:cleft lip and palate associated transmembrane protein [Boletus reticuloceps]
MAESPARQGAHPALQEENSSFRKVLSAVQVRHLHVLRQQLRLFSPAGEASPSAGQVNPFLLPPQHAHLAWPLGQPLSMHVYFSTSPNGDVFSRQWTSGWREDQDKDLPFFVWSNVTFGDWNDHRTEYLDITLPEVYSHSSSLCIASHSDQVVQRNATLWADVFLTKEGANPDPSDPSFDPHSVHHIRKALTRYLPKAKIRKEKNLLSNSDDAQEEEEVDEEDVIVSHWHKNLTLVLISDETVIPFDKLPPVTFEHVHLVPGARDPTGTKGFYKPIVFPNDFWLLRSHLTEINATTPNVPLQITFQPMSYFKFQLFASMTHGFDEAIKQQGGGTGTELDEVKRMLLETNPWFLALTGLVGVLHTVFEMLAFKSDVSHWRQRKELVGVSVRTVRPSLAIDRLVLVTHLINFQIIANVFVQTVILLYLIDNNADTSWMILLGSGMGVVIEAWKITKAVDIRIVPAPAGSMLPYVLSIKDKHVLSEDEKKTQEYDKLAFRYVSYVAIPLLVAYGIYSLVYETHKGWYSYIISTLTSFVYMFGFAQLIPQLIINYKLKSVAHMPMKAMIYKSLSTVVDDLFA